jgi:hypothetical protein
MTRLVLFAIAFFVVLNDRLYIQLDTDGSGLLHVMDLAIPVIAGLAVMFSRKSIMPRFGRNRSLQYCLPYLLLGLVLPTLGVLTGAYPWRTLLNAIVSIRALALIALGIWLAQQPPRTRELAARLMVFCIALEAFSAVCQFITLQQLFDTPFLEWLYQWDVRTMTDHKEAYLITGRSTGTFLGGNILGVWGVIAVWFSVTALSGTLRLVCAAASLLTLVLSQSRGSIAAFLAGLVVAVLFLSGMKRRVRFGLAAAVIIAISLGARALADGGWLSSNGLQSEGMQTRFASGLEALLHGTSADANAISRVEAWADAIPFFMEHPLGTWGEPQFLMNHFIDNQYVSAILQGSLPFAAALLLALYAGLRTTGSPAMRSFLALSAVSIAVNAMSANPFQYPAIGIYWLALGYSTRRQQAERRAAGPPIAHSRPWRREASHAGLHVET